MAQNAARGGFAGFAATIPMTLFMLAVHRWLQSWQQYAVPPQRITDKVAWRLGLRKEMEPEQLRAAALVSHFTYGTGIGVCYALLIRPWLRTPVAGIVYGVLVWAAGYIGWLPLMRILPPATKEPQGRNVMMIGAHVVYGGVLGLASNLRWPKPWSGSTTP